MSQQATTLGDLKSSGYRVLPVKAELRQNLIRKLRENEPLFPGIIGFDDTVLPQLYNALLGGQDIIMLGELFISKKAKPPIGISAAFIAVEGSIGKNIFNRITTKASKTIKTITVEGLNLKVLSYSSSYLISPPKTPGICN